MKKENPILFASKLKTFFNLEAKPTLIQNSYLENKFAPIFAYWAFFICLISFNSYAGEGLLSKISSLPCFPHFQSCKTFFNITPLPYSYKESLLFTIIFSLITMGVIFLYKKKYYYAHIILWILFTVKILICLLNYGLGNYDYYDLVLILIFLIYPSRRELIKVTFVILYFLASTIKIHEGWIAGTYFSSLYYGLPLIPFILIPAATNIVILMQMLGGWFLLSKNSKISTLAIYFFIFFHIYSAILVGFRYPFTSLFSLLIIFGVGIDKEKNIISSLKKERSYSFFLIIIILFILQFVAIKIPGDQKITLEGNNYGLFMFEANHQCISTVTFNKIIHTRFSYDARNRCDPYVYLKMYQKQFCLKGDEKYAWEFEHSINGNSFQKIIDEPDLCKLVYKPFVHNSWIKLESEATATGLPYKNIYLASDGVDSSYTRAGQYLYPSSLSTSQPIETSWLQKNIIRHITIFYILYWILWISTILRVLKLFVSK
ncbi:MAG: hypothetical protein KBC50_03460 [Candidatus Pacebacteria bacterium]|nr:hypothetical protein [Candidatus Paceibacterota bacterium]